MIAFLFLFGCGGGGSGGLSPNTNGNINGTSVGSGPGKATLNWDAPTTHTDGSPLSNLAGFKLHYGTSSPVNGSNSAVIDVGNNTSYAITGLDPGTYFFAVSAYDDAGTESEFSNEVSKAIGAT